MARRDDLDTLPPGTDDKAATAFEREIRARGEWRARLENLGRLAGLVQDHDHIDDRKAAA
jgi:hypothetical protein